MLLTLTTTHTPATDLGYLLHKNPSRLQTVRLGFGAAHVFYPEATAERCTAALLLDVDPIALVRGRKGRGGGERLLDQYVNDRPFVASSFLSVAIAQTFGSALGGRSKERPDLAAQPIPLTANVHGLRCVGGERLLRDLFEPLGYAITATERPLDATIPELGGSRCFDVTLTRECRLAELLGQLYVLIPVLDDEKHYWVGEAEVEKLLRHGGEWLQRHPLRDTILKRYLARQGWLARLALRQLADGEDPDLAAVEHGAEEAAIETPIRLNDVRIATVVDALKDAGARTVVDLGCGEGRLLRALLDERGFDRVVGVDVSAVALQHAEERLKLDRMPELRRRRIQLLLGSLTYRDARLTGFDAATAIEVVEHLEPHRLATFTHNLFANVDAACTVVTTPNREFNARFPALANGALRHRDHRFEWTRAEFRAWAEAAALRHGRSVTFHAIGEDDPALGPPTQMAVFLRTGGTP